jgi:hypothetical protein
MTKRKNPSSKVPAGRQRHITVRGVRKENPDIEKLARALIAMGLEEARKKAEDDHHQKAA